MKEITARYDGFCKGCGERFPAGTRILWQRQLGSYHANPSQGCTDIAWGNEHGRTEAIEERKAYDAEAEWEKRQMAHENAEYAAGVADANRYMQDKQMFGEELAEQFEMEHEMFLYNNGMDGG